MDDCKGWWMGSDFGDGLGFGYNLKGFRFATGYGDGYLYGDSHGNGVGTGEGYKRGFKDGDWADWGNSPRRFKARRV